MILDKVETGESGLTHAYPMGYIAVMVHDT